MLNQREKEMSDEIQQQLNFVEWLKENNLYNEYDNAATMRRMQAVWLANQQQGEKYRIVLEKLVLLKNHKDHIGKDVFYKTNQPIAWKQAADTLGVVLPTPQTDTERKS